MVMLAARPSSAQTTADPSAIERTIPRETTQKPVDPTLKTSLPDVERGPAIQGSFVLGAVHISGATTFSMAQLASDYEPYLATVVDDARLKEIVARITARYHAAGYPLAFAMLPAQNVRAGVIQINVIEGRVHAVDIEGAGNNKRTLEAIAAPLLDEKPLRTATLERVLGLIRDLPGFYIADVRVGRDENDLANHRLTIHVVKDIVRALAYSDNRGTVNGARARLYSSLGLASLMTTGDELRLNGFAIPGDNFHYLYGQAAYSLPLGNKGLALDLSGSYGDQHQRAFSAAVDGTSTNISAQLRYPILRSRALTVVARLAANDWYSVSRHDVTRIQRDHIRVARLGIGITKVATGQINADFWLAQGLGFDASTRPGDPLASRPDAGGKFTKASFTLQASKPLSSDMTMRTMVAGQYSSRPLLSVEEFALGGSQIGRAYDFNSLTGDHGFGGAVEIGYRIGESVGPLKQVELFSFVDGGAVFQKRNPIGYVRHHGLASMGGGTRFAVLGISVSAEAGIPLYAIAGRDGLQAFLSASKAF